ncbi:hypothetical protein [Enterococcus sp. AZ109]|uniref:hypothetical protein n=1 Tax=Enterococcus sp. AZ109 TaxID=2774634 RepID=UPI003F29B291
MTKMRSYLLRGAVLVFASALVLFAGLIFIQITSSEQTIINLPQCLFIASLYAALALGLRLALRLYQWIALVDSSGRFSDSIRLVIASVKRLSMRISLVLLGILPKFYLMADSGDAPGLLFVGLGVVVLPLVVYLTAVLGKLQNQGLQEQPNRV